MDRLDGVQKKPVVGPNGVEQPYGECPALSVHIKSGRNVGCSSNRFKIKLQHALTSLNNPLPVVPEKMLNVMMWKESGVPWIARLVLSDSMCGEKREEGMVRRHGTELMKMNERCCFETLLN
ncbi:hypothetical protein AVEN_5534-1 [Araneus ventricosus]|uniref:Uncharacterized protein n=1 Tax=Araneus ventricosus TaxID=182803 RepID=A0A4Y2DUM1_ARAVE|nr:hypothetical protein AVEN_5534-1 [Araneus ventricosus]